MPKCTNCLLNLVYLFVFFSHSPFPVHSFFISLCYFLSSCVFRALSNYDAEVYFVVSYACERRFDQYIPYNNGRIRSLGLYVYIFVCISGYKFENFHLIEANPCGGGVEYLHRDPASRRRRRKGKSRIWDSKIWSRVQRDLDPIMTALARASSNCKRQIHPLVRENAPTSTNPQLSESNQDLVVSPRWVLYSKTDWPADRRS
jgi:hypothetical protein